jgi:Domain of unknown function (DUF4375)
MLRVIFSIAKRVLGFPEPQPFYWPTIVEFFDVMDLDSKPKKFLEKFETIPEMQRNVLAAHIVVSGVREGAFPFFFFNGSSVLAPEAVIALKNIGLPEAAKVLQEAIQLFGAEYPRAYARRSKIAGSAIDPRSKADQAFSSLLYEKSDEFLVALGPRLKKFDLLVRKYINAVALS